MLSPPQVEDETGAVLATYNSAAYSTVVAHSDSIQSQACGRVVAEFRLRFPSLLILVAGKRLSFPLTEHVQPQSPAKDPTKMDLPEHVPEGGEIQIRGSGLVPRVSAVPAEKMPEAEKFVRVSYIVRQRESAGNARTDPFGQCRGKASRSIQSCYCHHQPEPAAANEDEMKERHNNNREESVGDLYFCKQSARRMELAERRKHLRRENVPDELRTIVSEVPTQKRYYRRRICLTNSGLTLWSPSSSPAACAIPSSRPTRTSCCGRASAPPSAKCTMIIMRNIAHPEITRRWKKGSDAFWSHPPSSRTVLVPSLGLSHRDETRDLAQSYPQPWTPSGRRFLPRVSCVLSRRRFARSLIREEEAPDIGLRSQPQR